MKSRIQQLFALALLSTLNLQLSTFAQGTAFTYQGRLNDGANPATGIYDLRFAVYGAGSGGSAVAGPVTNSATAVTNGLFCVTLDFGGGVFTGQNRWLEIAARTNGTAAFTPLTPRQALTPTPYALFASNTATLGGQAPGAFAPATGSGAYVAKSGDTMTGTLNLPANGLAAGGTQLILSGGNVGIGTAASEAKMEIAGYGNNLKLTRPGVSAAFGVWVGLWGGNPQLTLGNWENGKVMTMDTNGNVGIGTATPQARLQVVGSAEAETRITSTATGGGDWIWGTGWSFPGSIHNLYLYDCASSPHAVRMVVDSLGNVGIGTTTPGAPLEIAGYGNNLKLTRPGVSAAFGVMVGLAGGNPFLTLGNWETGQGMSIDTNGRVGIGTTTPATTLDVNGTVRATAFQGDGSGLTGLPNATGWSLTGNSGTSGDFLGTTDNQPLEFRINNQTALRLQPGASGAPNVIGGSSENVVGTGANAATIGGGYGNQIESATGDSTIGGGYHNRIQGDSGLSTIGGGGWNMIQSSASYGAIGGGYQNTIQSKADYATIPGGLNNVAGGNYSLAAGHNAKAGHLSAFVWADSSGGTFASSAANQFLIRAAGGVGIGITNPATALDVNGTVSATAFQGDGSGLTGVSFGGWSLNGNSATTTSNFLGTTDGQPLELRVNNGRALRIESAGYTANIIGGLNANSVSSGAVGATIAGGGDMVFVSFPTPHFVANPNTVQQNYGTISGGRNNTVSGYAGTVSGGINNVAGGSYSFAAGYGANAAYDGSFVWADSQGGSFDSTGVNQFLIRAAGGVGINTASPNRPLTIQGSGTGSDWVSLRNSSGSPLWHLNGINGGLNFAHTDVADAVLFLGANNSVGIGTSNPQAALDVNGTVQASGPIKAVGGLVIENRTSDPPSPATGQIWLRTDL